MRPRHHSLFDLSFILSFSVLYLVVFPAHAGRWFVEPTASLRGMYDDNVRLETTNILSDQSAQFTLDSRFGYRDELSETKLQVQLDSERFASLEDLDGDDQKLGLESTFRFGLNRFGLTAAYERDGTRNTEQTTTGLIQTRHRRILRTLTPFWEYQISERSSLFANYYHTDVSYDSEAPQVDYLYKGAVLGVSHSLSEAVQLRGQLGYSKFEVDENSTIQKTKSFNVGLFYQLSEKMVWSVSAGQRKTESAFQELTFFPATLSFGFESQSVTSTTSQLDTSLEAIRETGSIKVQLGISEQPSGDGRLLQTSRLALYFKHKISEKLSLGLDLAAYINETGGGLSIDSDDREYFMVKPAVYWRLSEWWSISADYRYRQQEFTSSNSGVAESNAFFISLSYVWPRENDIRWMRL